MTKIALSGAVLLLSSMLPLRGQTSLGDSTLAGKLQAEDGTPMADVKVAYTRVVRFVSVDRGGIARLEEAPGEVRVSGSVRSQQDGSFEVGGLPAGDYQLCVRGVPGFLDPCLWTTGWIDLPDVNSGERRDAGVVILKRGGTLKVRVNDPQRLLSAETAISDGGLILGVQLEDGVFHRLNTTSTDLQGRDMQMTVPHDMPLRLWAFSRIAVVSDGDGNVIGENGSWLPFRIPTGATIHQVVLDISPKP